LNNLAESLMPGGDYTRAESLFRRAVGIIERLLGLSSDDFPADVAAVDMAPSGEQVPLAVKLIYYNSAAGLGQLRRLQGPFAEAEARLTRVVALGEDLVGPDAPATASALNNLAVVYKYRGRYDRAEPLYQRARTILESTCGDDRTPLAQIYYNLAGLCHATGRFAAGEPLARRALALQEKSLGPSHFDVAITLSNLAANLEG